MDVHTPPAVDAHVTDAVTAGNLKVIVDSWVSLAERFLIEQLVYLGENGHLRQPDHPYLHRPGGLVDQWRALARAHSDALEDAKRTGGLPDVLLPWAYPQFDRFVLHFMAAALRVRPGD